MPPPFMMATSAWPRARIASAIRLPIAAERHVHFAVQQAFEARHRSRDLRIGRHGRGIDDAELRPPRNLALVALLLDLEVEVDDRHVMRVVGRLDHQRAAVEIDEQVVGVSGQDQVCQVGPRQLERLRAVRVHHRDHEVGTVALQRLALRPHGCDRGLKCQVARVRHARRAVMRRPGQSDPQATERDDVAILEARNELAVRIGHVGGEQRKLHFRGALEECRLAEVEFVIARHEDVRLDHVGEIDDVRALVDARHQRRRQRVPAMREQHRAAGRPRTLALRLHHGGKPRESAALFAVRHGGFAHLVDVVGQHEGELCALRPRKTRRHHRCGGEAKRNCAAADIDH
jgi:hypothetical protein